MDCTANNTVNEIPHAKAYTGSLSLKLIYRIPTTTRVPNNITPYSVYHAPPPSSAPILRIFTQAPTLFIDGGYRSCQPLSTAAVRHTRDDVTCNVIKKIQLLARPFPLSLRCWGVLDVCPPRFFLVFSA